MPFYYTIDGTKENEKRIARGLLELKDAFVKVKIPRRNIEDTLLLATWNIREFDSPKYGARGKEPLFYIAEIINCFDLVAVQEVRDDLAALNKLMGYLGGWWKYLLTDITEGTQGNRERMAFVYDSRKLSFGGLASEIVIPPVRTAGRVLTPARQLARDGQIDLAFLDESGFAPTFPISYTWARQGVRPTVAYEAPQGRRVNVIGAFLPWAEHERFVYQSFLHSIKAPHFLEFVWSRVAGMQTPLGELPEGFDRQRPCIIVLDNYSVHKNKEVKAYAEAFQAAAISFFFLPPYSPELNLIEPIWRHVKYQDIPIRSHSTAPDLKKAVDTALHQRAQRLAALTPPSDPTHGTVVTHSANSLPKAA